MKIISIVTINRNNAAELKRTIESVERFAPESSEYIVIDGASTDGSLEAIRSSKRINAWTSEPDTGIYNAINKGIARATGDYLLFLNSGDCLREDNGLAGLPDDNPEVFYSDAVVVDQGRSQTIRYPDILDVNYFIGGMINHQNALIRRELFLKLGSYDDTYKLRADWLFFLKAAYEAKARFVHLPLTMVEFGGGGLSSRPESDRVMREETKAGIRSVFGELAPSILELLDYRDSIYGNILARFGAGHVLDLLLRSYRFVVRRTRKISRAVR
jgi:glycosyltransferase involved in cell wall biosynthesis